MRRINFFLMHMETGQRYPLTEGELVVGRNSGDVIYPDDSKLSHQHCRIFTTPQGLFLHDLKSHNGTFLDNARLDPEKTYLLKPGMVIRLGDQSLKFQEAYVAKRNHSKRRKKGRRGGFDFAIWISGTLLVASLIGFIVNLNSMKRTRDVQITPEIVSPYEMVDKEVQSAFEGYKQMGASFKSGKISDSQAAKLIRNQLLPKFSSVQVKLAVVKPVSEYDRQRMELNKKLLISLGQQLESFAKFVESKDQKYAKEVEKFATEAEVLREQLSQLRRQPAVDQ